MGKGNLGEMPVVGTDMDARSQLAEKKGDGETRIVRS